MVSRRHRELREMCDEGGSFCPELASELALDPDYERLTIRATRERWAEEEAERFLPAVKVAPVDESHLDQLAQDAGF